MDVLHGSIQGTLNPDDDVGCTRAAGTYPLQPEIGNFKQPKLIVGRDRGTFSLARTPRAQAVIAKHSRSLPPSGVNCQSNDELLCATSATA
jgi:hypothetical protein